MSMLILFMSMLSPLRVSVISASAVAVPIKASAPSLSDDEPRFLLAETTRANDVLTVALYLQNCVGIDAGSMIVKYDPAVLKRVSVSNGKDADQVN